MIYQIIEMIQKSTRITVLEQIQKKNKKKKRSKKMTFRKFKRITLNFFAKHLKTKKKVLKKEFQYVCFAYKEIPSYNVGFIFHNQGVVICYYKNKWHLTIGYAFYENQIHYDGNSLEECYDYLRSVV